MRFELSLVTRRKIAGLGLLLLAVICHGAIAFGQASSQGVTNTSRFATFEELQSLWRTRPREELQKAVEAGDGNARYYYALSTWTETQEEIRQTDARWRRANAGRPVERGTIVRTNWAGVSEAEILQLAEAGDRGAQSFIIRVQIDRATTNWQRDGFTRLMQAAEQSVVPAQYSLASLYLEPAGWDVVKHDPKEGVRWLRQAADGGYEKAQLQLAEMLIAGEFVPVDLAGGIEWLQRAADQNSAGAQFGLAQQYACGNGAPRSSAETPAALFRKAAEGGWPDAQFALAERHRLGVGGMRDPFEAIRWYRKAAIRSQPGSLAPQNAQKVLALVNERGERVRHDNLRDPEFLAALQLYRKAVNLRDALSAHRIADRYATGRGVERDATKAFFWYNLAANQGLAEAAGRRDQMKASLAKADHDQLERWLEELRLEP